MKSIIEVMLEKYHCKSVDDYTNALKEIIQEIALLGLWRSKFFEHASFYGGTALRIFHQLNRFSEDLDFSLVEKNPKFKLEKYSEALMMELKSFGFNTEIITKPKENFSNIDTLLLETNTKTQLLSISAPSHITDIIHHQRKITIKMEVDIDPPLNFNTESLTLLNPIPFEVNVFQLPDLFATKTHAILCRNWQTRVKGRDWFDFIWYVAHDIPLRLKHLQERLVKSGLRDNKQILHEKDVIELLKTKIDNTDFELAKKDVRPFIIDHQSLNLWSSSFFHKLINKINFINS